MKRACRWTQIALCASSFLLVARAQSYNVFTVAGSPAPLDSIPASTASLVSPTAVATDAAGNFYFASLGYIFKVNSAGLLTRVAGDGAAGFAGDGGSALAARFNQPSGLAVNTNGDVYVADTGNGRIRKISRDGTISTAVSSVTFPSGVAVDSSDTLFIPDISQHRILKISPGGATSILAQISNPSSLTLDAVGNLYVVDGGTIRKISPTGVITTIAGGGTADPGTEDIPATQVMLVSPTGVAAGGGVLYIAEPPRIRKVAANGIITTIAGGRSQGFTQDGVLGAKALLYGVSSVAIDINDNVLFTDRFNNRVRKISPNGILTTVAGDGFVGPAGDGGPALSAQFQGAFSVALDSTGNLLIADTGRNRIRKVSGGTITAVAGDTSATALGDGGPATSAKFTVPMGLAFDADGNLFISELSRVRMIAPNGIISTFAGGDLVGYFGDGGKATRAIFAFIYSLAFDSKGNLYLADHDNSRIRKISLSGIVTTVAGNGTRAYCGDGGPATQAAVEQPTAVAIDGNDNLYIAAGAGVRMVTPAGTITSVAPYGPGGDTPCVPSNIVQSFLSPKGLAVDRAGNLYISDYSTIRKRSPNGIITTIAGTGVSGYSGDGGAAANAQIQALGLAVDSGGNVFFAAGDRVRVLRPQASSQITITNGASNVAGPVSPGEIVVLYGSGIGPTQLTSLRMNAAGTVATELAGTTVKFNGTPAPLLYTSASQVAAIVPYGISGTTAAVSVSYSGATAAGSAVIAASAPGLFTSDSTGKGQAAAINQDGIVNGTATPARAGDFISLYATGEGLTAPTGVDGGLAPLSAPVPILPVTVKIGGQTAPVQYAGGAPGLVNGLLQINVQIPGGTPPGNALVVVQVGTASSQGGVTIAVR